MERIEEFDPCKPCLCSGTPCEQCMFGYKREKERIGLLKENKYPGIVQSYNLLHNRTNNCNSDIQKSVIATIDLTQMKNNVHTHIVPATPKYTVEDDGIYIPHEFGCSRMIIPKETFVEAYNKYIKGEK